MACLVGPVLSVLGGSAVLALSGVALGERSGTSTGSSAAASAAPAPAAPPTTPAAPAASTAAPSVSRAPASAPAPVAAPSPAAPRPTSAPAPRAVAGLLVPVVGVTDGDTIKVRVGGVTERVRLIGLDAPELRGDECWAQKASSRMQSLVQSRSVRLVADRTQDDRDRYGRLLRHVVTGDGRLVAQVLIEGGFAKEYTYDAAYAHRAAYVAAEKRARAGKLGVWSAACAAPVVAAPAPAAPAKPAKPAKPAASGSCVIKGNISSSGEKIFHVPGGGSYDDTVITESKGERWFCTEQQAVDAGWRKARN